MSEQTKTCACGEKHQGHLCVLRSKGMTDVIACVTDQPTVICFNCGSLANSADNVCVPMPLEDK